MSHSDNMSQKFLDLYQLRQASIASTLHSNLAQPIVAAKNFAAAITTIQGDDEKLQEARELASVILEMTDQAYTAADAIGYRELRFTTTFEYARNPINGSRRYILDFLGLLCRSYRAGLG